MQVDKHFGKNVEVCIADYGEVDQVRLLKKVNSVHSVEIVTNHPELPFSSPDDRKFDSSFSFIPIENVRIQLNKLYETFLLGQL